MRRLFLVLLVVTVGLSSVQGQSKEVVVAYFNKDLEKVYDPKADIHFYRTVERRDTCFLVRDYTMPKSLRMKAECSAFAPNLIFNGKVTYYYENGNIEEEGTYKEDNRAGVFQYFYNTGDLKEEREYTDGEIRYLQSFSENGETLINKGNGLVSERTEDVTRFWEIKDYKKISILLVDSNDTIYAQYDTPPEYRGGYDQMMRDIASIVRYPAAARRQSVQGQVFVSFVISKSGAVENISILKGVSRECDAEAMRVVSLLKGWMPAMHKGKIVKSRYIFPLRYKLGT